MKYIFASLNTGMMKRIEIHRQDLPTKYSGYRHSSNVNSSLSYLDVFDGHIQSSVHRPK